MSTRNIVERMETRKNSGIFVLGSYERRVSVVSQQVRALNLIHSLFDCERLSHGRKVLVIGAGIAGLTAAAAAAVRGCVVKVFEREDCEIPLFKNSRRCLHPYAYDWPDGEWYVEQAQIPLMYWYAAEAQDVREQVLKRWMHVHNNCYFTPKVHLKASFELDKDNPRHVRWTDNNGSSADDFDTVILAVGFGREAPHQQELGMWPHEYWEAPNEVKDTTSKRYLVSGCGDGAFADVIRLCYGPSFSPILDYLVVQDERMRKADGNGAKAQMAKLAFELATVQDNLVTIEQGLADLQEQEYEEYLWKQYAGLSAPRIDAYLKEAIRLHGQVVLNGETKHPLHPRASIYHRFVVSRLLLATDVQVYYRPSKLKYVYPPSGPTDTYKAEFYDGSHDCFNDVITRVGPKPALAADVFRNCHDAGRMRNFAELIDITLVPTWEPGDFKTGSQIPTEIRYLDPDWEGLVSKVRSLADRAYSWGEKTAHACRLSGASGVWYPPDRVHCHYHTDFPYSKPTWIAKAYARVLRSLKIKHAKSAAAFFDGPCARLVSFKEEIVAPSEDRHLVMHLAPIGWYDYSVVEELLQRSLCTNAEGPRINLVKLVEGRDMKQSCLPNILDTATTVVTSDGQLFYAERGQVSVDAGRMSAAVAENINTVKDQTGIGDNVDPFRTVRRGIEEELSPKLVSGKFPYTTYLIGICFGLQSLHPTLIFITAVDATSTEVLRTCRERPGKDYKEGCVQHVSAVGDDRQLISILGSDEWVAGGKAAFIRAVEFLDGHIEHEGCDIRDVVKRLASGEVRLD